jgi:hypothetical protein
MSSPGPEGFSRQAGQGSQADFPRKKRGYTEKSKFLKRIKTTNKSSRPSKIRPYLEKWRGSLSVPAVRQLSAF